MKNNICLLRKQKKLLQKDVALACNIPVRTYGSYESGEREPSLFMLCKLADFFDVTVDELLGRVPAPALFDDARVERPEILQLYESLTEDLQARAIAYLHGLADLAATQNKTSVTLTIENSQRKNV